MATKWVLGLFGIALLAFALLLIGDGVYIGLLAPSAVVSEYHFGAEAMVSHGGWGYTSRGAYFWSSLFQSAIFWIPGLLALWYVLMKHRAKKAS